MIQVKKTESIVQSREIPLTRRKNYLEETKMRDAPSQMRSWPTETYLDSMNNDL